MDKNARLYCCHQAFVYCFVCFVVVENGCLSCANRGITVCSRLAAVSHLNSPDHFIRMTGFSESRIETFKFQNRPKNIQPKVILFRSCVTLKQQ